MQILILQRNHVGADIPLRATAKRKLFRYDVDRQEKVETLVSSSPFGPFSLSGTVYDFIRHGPVSRW